MGRESKLQKRIIENLERDGWLVVKIITCNKTGWPDINAIRMNEALYKEVLYIEVKDKGKKAKPLQSLRHEQIRQHGGRVYTVDSWEQFKSLDI